MRFFSKVSLVLFPLIAMQFVLRNVKRGIYLDINRENQPVLMYLDLTMYVMIAFVVATFLTNMIKYNDTNDKNAYMPMIFITICTLLVSILNLFLYETEIEQENKKLMAIEMRELRDMKGIKQPKASLLEGYWIHQDDKDQVSSIYYYDGQGNVEVYNRNTAFSEVISRGSYKIRFENDLGYLTTEEYGTESKELISFKNRNTLIGVSDSSTGLGEHKFKTIRLETMTFYLERISQKQFLQYQREVKEYYNM